MPIVSVIIPTYNNKKLLVEAIDSVLSQSLTDLELLVVDDGSNDGTEDAVKSIGDSRIRYFYKDNQGVSSARNIGIQHAEGDYAAFLDSDDLYLPGYLEVMVSALKNNPDYGVVYASATIKHPDGTIIDRRKEKLCQSGWITKNLFLRFFVYCQASVIRRHLIKSLLFDEDLTMAEDQDFFLRLSLLTKFLYVPAGQVMRRVQIDSLSREKGLGRVHMDIIRVPERFYLEHNKNEQLEQFISRYEAHTFLSRRYRKIGVRLYKHGQIGDALSCFRRSLSYKKSNLSALGGLIRCWLLKFLKKYR